MNEIVRLRALEFSDLDCLYEVENDRSNWASSISSAFYSRAALKDFICKSCQFDIYTLHQLRLVVEIPSGRKSGQTVGFVDLTDFSPQNYRAEVGILIFPAFRRRGYGRSALQQLTQFVISAFSLHQLYAYVSCYNIPSVKLFKSLDFIESGILKGWFRKGHGYEDAFLYQKEFL